MRLRAFYKVYITSWFLGNSKYLLPKKGIYNVLLPHLAHEATEQYNHDFEFQSIFFSKIYIFRCRVGFSWVESLWAVMIAFLGVPTMTIGFFPVDSEEINVEAIEKDLENALLVISKAECSTSNIGSIHVIPQPGPSAFWLWHCWTNFTCKRNMLPAAPISEFGSCCTHFSVFRSDGTTSKSPRPSALRDALNLVSFSLLFPLRHQKSYQDIESVSLKSTNHSLHSLVIWLHRGSQL